VQQASSRGRAGARGLLRQERRLHPGRATPLFFAAQGDYAIHLAARKNAAKVVELLLAQGADVNLESKREDTPLEVAAEDGPKDAATLLLAKGAKVTPKAVDAARKRGNAAVVELLERPGGGTP